MDLSEKIKEYRTTYNCSLQHARNSIIRNEFCKELRSGKNIEDLADTLIRILDFELGGYNG